MRAWRKWLVVSALALAGLLSLYELTWIGRSGVALVLVGFGTSIVLLALAVLLGRATEKTGELRVDRSRLPKYLTLIVGALLMLLCGSFLVWGMISRQSQAPDARVTAAESVPGPEHTVGNVRFFDMTLDTNGTLLGRMENRGDSPVFLNYCEVKLYNRRNGCVDSMVLCPRLPPGWLAELERRGKPTELVTEALLAEVSGTYVKKGGVQSFVCGPPSSTSRLMRFPKDNWHWDYAPVCGPQSTFPLDAIPDEP
jgi:hypothetical protein